MKLLLDQGLPRSAVTELASLGWDVVHVGEIGMAAATDQEILRRADAEQRAVVTLDADFHTMLALQGASSPSVIWVRIEGLRGGGVVADRGAVTEALLARRTGLPWAHAAGSQARNRDSHAWNREDGCNGADPASGTLSLRVLDRPSVGHDLGSSALPKAALDG
jgi:predicted nuclease of predicted toxin-antitoxin system